MANPYLLDFTTGQRGVNQAAGNLANTVGRLGQQMRMDEQKAQQEARMAEGVEKYQQAIANNDIQALSETMLEFPEMAQVARNAYGFANEQTERAATDIYTQAIINPEQAPEILRAGAGAIEQLGGAPKMTMIDAEKMQNMTPEERQQYLLAGVTSIDPQLGKNLFDQIQALRPNQPEQPKPMTEYQKIQTNLRQQEIELKKADAEQKRLDREIQRETNQLRKEQLIAEKEAKQKESAELKAQDELRVVNGINDAALKKQVIDDLLDNKEYIESLTGWEGRAPATTDAGLEAEAFLDNIKNTMTLENLSVMSGPLTDKDVQLIASASSKLRAGMSEKVLKQELNKIKSAYDRVIKNFTKEANRKGYSLDDGGDDDNGDGGDNKIKERTIGRFKVREG